MEAVHQLITRRVEDEDKVSEVMMGFNKKNNDQDRVKYVLKVMQEFDVIPRIPAVSKNSMISEKCGEEGTRLFLKDPSTAEDFIKILHFYTKSIAYAKLSSKELALGYDNRSAVLLQIKQYKECISDIDRALFFQWPDNLKIKLYMRRIECLLELGESINDDYTTTFNMVKQMPENLEKNKFLKMLRYLRERSTTKKKSKKQRYTMSFPVIKSPNVEVPCASDAVAIDYNSRYGRHIVATRDIAPGELIAVENAYAYILDPVNTYTHCAHCMEYCLATIPCDYCFCSMYCSEKCRLENWKKFHDVECFVFCVLFEISDSHNIKFNFLCIRLALQAFREAGSIHSLQSQLKEINEQHDPRTKGFDANMKFHSDKYTSIYSLMTNVEKRSSFDIFRRTIDACILLYLLVKYSTFFGQRYEMKLSEIAEYEDATFIGGLILTHQQLIPSNAHSLEETYDYNPRERGIVAMAFYSLFNHSCEPNVIRYSVDTSIVMRAIYPIKKGEQLFDNYGMHYAIKEKSKRQEELLGQYYFFCECIPCRKNWRTHVELPSFEELLKPPHQKSFITKTLRKLDSYMIFIASANKKDIEERQDIIQDILNMIKILYDRSLFPSTDMNKAVETVKYAYHLCGNLYGFPNV